jgi:hypothetical protein
VETIEQALRTIEEALQLRKMALVAGRPCSEANAILTVVVDQSVVSFQPGDGEYLVLTESKLNFVDIISQPTDEADGSTNQEDINILEDVLTAVQGKKRFVPYRQSKLTWLLKGALEGNKTLLITCVAPIVTKDTLASLRYAQNIQTGSNKESPPAQPLISAGTPRTFASPVSDDAPLQSYVDRLGKTEQELRETRARLRVAQRDRRAAEEQMCLAKAEKELDDIRLSVLTGEASDDTPTVSALEAAFLTKAQSYEKKIASLRRALKEADLKIREILESAGDEDDQGSETVPQLLNVTAGSGSLTLESSHLDYVQEECPQKEPEEFDTLRRDKASDEKTSDTTCGSVSSRSTFTICASKDEMNKPSKETSPAGRYSFKKGTEESLFINQGYGGSGTARYVL